MAQKISIIKENRSTIVKRWDSIDNRNKDVFLYNNNVDVIFNLQQNNVQLPPPKCAEGFNIISFQLEDIVESGITSLTLEDLAVEFATKGLFCTDVAEL